jgi:uncharacterized membrane protein YphA (DoxX/SURF4 family)
MSGNANDVTRVHHLTEETFMQSDTETAPVSKKMLWAGRIMSALPALMLLFSGVMKLVKPASVMEGFTRLGYPESLAVGIGIVELVCTVLYLIPRTSILGAILLTGYLGGATATHVRVGEPFYMPIVLGVLVWAGLFLRENRLRALLPLRR